MPTIRSLLLGAAAASPEGVFLRWKEGGAWRAATFRETAERARAAAEALASLGVRPGERVALMMENRPEWFSAYLGIVCAGFTAVPVDPKLRPAEVSHILRDSGAVAFVGSGRAWPVVEETIGTLRFMRAAALLDGAVPADFRAGRVAVRDWGRLVEAAAPAAGRPDSFFDRNEPAEGDVASIIYTSGTTGRAKGAMLTHANFLAQKAVLQRFDAGPDDNFLLVLPLHHAFAFTVCFLLPLALGCSVSLVESLRTIPENMREAKPTVLVAVPLLAEKILGVVNRAAAATAGGRALQALGLGRIAARRALDALGGRVRILITGGAASDPAMLRTWSRLGVSAFEGYGLTETAPVVALNPQHAPRHGSVGPAIPGHEVRIDAPGPDGIGEVQFRGPSVMKGYFRNEDATRACMDGEWFRTGDMGRLDADGYLWLTGRKKSLIVNREGKNINPEEVEIAINACPHVLESVVLGYRLPGDEVGEHVGAIVVADLDKIAAERNRSDADSASPLSDEQVRKLCTDEVREAMKALSAYKHPRRIRVVFEPLQKTNTFKVKRYLYSLDGAAADA